MSYDLVNFLLLQSIIFLTNLLPVAAHRAEDSPVKKSESFGQCFSNVSQADEEDGNSPEGIDDGDKLRKSSLQSDSLVDLNQYIEPPRINYKGIVLSIIILILIQAKQLG